MDLIDVLTPASVVIRTKANSKRKILQQVSAAGANLLDVPQSRILERLIERERLGSTGFGGGGALPHARLPGLRRPAAVLITLDQPVDFASLDGEPVDLVCGLFSPESAGADHLKALACLSRLLRNRAACDMIRGATTRDAAYAVLHNLSQREAA